MRLIVPAGHSITPSVVRKLPYNTLQDFAPIGLIGNGSNVLVIHIKVAAKSVREVIAFAKSRPGQLNYALTGHGNATHLAGELFKVLAGIDRVGVNYKGGKIRAFGVTTARRTAALPDVPTIAEAGVSGYEVDGWYGLLAPAATPPAIIARFNRDLAATVSTAEMKERPLGAGMDARPSTPAEFQARIARDITRWAAAVKKAQIAIE